MTPEEIAAMQAQNAKLQADLAEANKLKSEAEAKAQAEAQANADLKTQQAKEKEDAEKKKLEEQWQYQELNAKLLTENETLKSQVDSLTTSNTTVNGVLKEHYTNQYNSLTEWMDDETKTELDNLLGDDKDDPVRWLKKLPSLAKLLKKSEWIKWNLWGWMQKWDDPNKTPDFSKMTPKEQSERYEKYKNWRFVK